MNVLITGVAGFLGSHLALRHLKAGDFVVGWDDFTSSSDHSVHLKEMFKYNNFLFNRRNICASDVCSPKSISSIKFDIIYNFACPASPPIYQSIPIKTMLTCVLGTKNMLDIAMNHKAIFVQASTSEVYGDPNVSPQPESYRGCVNSYGPRSCYDEGKRAAEALCYDYMNSHGVDARLVRIFNTYGPHMAPNDGRIISNFVRDVIEDKPLTIYGDGTQTRSFCYVDDLIDGIQSLAFLQHNPKTPINIGNPVEYTLLEVVEIIEELFRYTKQIDVKYLPLPQDDPKQRKPAISLAKSLLNWEPKISLDRGIMRLYEYWRNVGIR